MLPKDPYLLLSVVNTKLRDFYPSLAALCGDLDVNEDETRAALSEVGYTYRADLNQFVSAEG